MTKTNGLPILNRRAARRRYAGLLATALALPAGAQTVPLSGVPATLPAQLARLYPATHFGAIKATAWPGVFEIAMGANLAYVDATGQYFMFGHLYDMQGQTDLTAAHEDTAGRVDFSRLPLADALRDVRGNGQRVLALFSDPDCPYCRRLEIALKGLTDVTLYTFLTPLAALHPEAPAKAIAIWCAPDRLAAWHAAMTHGVVPPASTCPHPVARNVALAERLGIVGTPTLIAADGRVLPGMVSASQLEAWLAQAGGR